MLALDEQLAVLADGSSLPVALVLAVLLGLRHATDPDHVAALASLVAGDERGSTRGAIGLGLAWGLGHGLTLCAVGGAFLLLGRDLPEVVRHAADVAIGFLIVVLSVRLLRRWRSGRFHVHEHVHASGLRHQHLHAHGHGAEHDHTHASLTRVGAFGIGLLHGLSGSAGVAVLLLTGVASSAVAVASLVLLAAGAAISMTAISAGFSLALVRSAGRRRLILHSQPALGFASLAIGVWYGLAGLAAIG